MGSRGRFKPDPTNPINNEIALTRRQRRAAELDALRKELSELRVWKRDVIAALHNYELNGSDAVVQIAGIYADMEESMRLVRASKDRAAEMAGELARLRKWESDIYQDNCENAYVETTILDWHRQALAEVAPDHPLLKDQMPSMGVWEGMRQRLDEAHKQLTELRYCDCGRGLSAGRCSVCDNDE